jgi:hypothetical protein
MITADPTKPAAIDGVKTLDADEGQPPTGSAALTGRTTPQ